MKNTETYLVTGANGFIATWIVKYLLEEGHTVHGTVRDANNAQKTAHLRQLAEGTEGTLKLFSADLLDAGAFDEPMQGVSVVLHTASPFVVGKVKRPQEQLIQPAVQGTRHVLEAVNRTPSVRRVVLTSSVVAIWGDNDEWKEAEGQVFDESHWNRTSSEKHQPYSYSKTLAEQEAWKLAGEQRRWDLVTINPGFVMGPTLDNQPRGASQEFIMSHLNGEFKSGAPKLSFATVDVREVARAHLLAAQKAEAKGRHLLANEVASVLDVAQHLEQAAPNKYPLAKKTVPTFLLYLVGPFMGFSWRYIRHNVGTPPRIDNRKSREELGIAYRPLADTLRDQVKQVQELGVG